MALSSQKNQQGAVLIVVLLLLMIMMVMAISLSSNTGTHAKIANNSVLKAQAFQAAESGSDFILDKLIEDSKKTLDDLKASECSKAFENQWKGEVEAVSTDTGRRKLDLRWYACFPNGQTPSSCEGGRGQCFSVIISGVACPISGSGSNSNNKVDVESCVITRHLQGYQIN